MTAIEDGGGATGRDWRAHAQTAQRLADQLMIERELCAKVDELRTALASAQREVAELTERYNAMCGTRDHWIAIAEVRLEENAALRERLRYIESQMHTNCSVSMDGMLRWSPRHTFRNLPGRTFAEAIDAALTTTAQGEPK